MKSLISGIYYMKQMNLYTENRQTHGLGEQKKSHMHLVRVAKGRIKKNIPGEGEGMGWTRGLELIDANYCIWSG